MNLNRIQQADNYGGIFIAGDVNTGGGDFITGDKYEIHAPPSRQDILERRNQMLLLEKVYQFWIRGVLEKSLYHEMWIEMNKEVRPELVEPPLDFKIRLLDQYSYYESSATISNVFNDSDRALLILGEPGSGKTIALLGLCEELSVDARNDPAKPIPVVLNLSSWGNKQLPFQNWIVDELNTKYQIPRKISSRWVDDFIILPLLDGLDEVTQEYRLDCLKSINKYGTEHGLSGIVVCCRLQEYQGLKKKLKLGGSILLRPLTLQQVDTYLTTIGSEMLGLREALRVSPIIQKLAINPLLLNVMSLAYAGQLTDFNDNASLSDRFNVKSVFTSYAKSMFRRRGNPNRYNIEQALKWLRALGRGIIKNQQTIFLIEQLQPSWLFDRNSRWIYILYTRLIFGLLFGAIIMDGNLAILGMGGICGLLAGVVEGVSQTRVSKSIHTTSLQRYFNKFYPFLFGTICSLLFGMIFLLTNKLRGGQEGWVFISNLSFGFSLNSLLFGVMLGVRNRVENNWIDVHTVDALKWSWKSTWKGAVRGFGWGFLLMSVFFPVSSWLVILATPGSYNQIMASADIKNSVIDTGLFLGLLWGVAFGIFGILLGGVFGGLQGFQILKTSRPNQGIWMSARNSIIGTIIISILTRPFWYISPTIYNEVIPVAFLLYGGLEVLKHILLRLLLRINRQLPWNLVQFLDYASELAFLRKVGGGYVFTHRALMEYFASLTDTEIKSLAISKL